MCIRDRVYLYLLRCLSTSAAKTPEVSISSIADKFNHTEKDVKRALKYWEKLNLLQLEYGEDKSLKSICITKDLQEVELAREQVSVTTAAESKGQAPVMAAQTAPRQDAPRQDVYKRQVQDYLALRGHWRKRDLSENHRNNTV